MTRTQKDEIVRMRGECVSYSKISKALNIPVSTIKSFCQVNNLGAVLAVKSQSPGHCRNCGKKLKPSTQSAVKRFCSDTCRMTWWKKHPEAINRKAVHTISCSFCGKEFEAYINGNRKYCCRTCYGKSKAVRT